MSANPEDKTTKLERAEQYIYLAAGYILVIAAAGLLVTALFGCATVRPEGDVVPVEAPTPRETGTVEVGQPYFDFTGPLLGGGEFSLSQEVGRAT